MRDLQAHVTLCNFEPRTSKKQTSGSSPLVGSGKTGYSAPAALPTGKSRSLSLEAPPICVFCVKRRRARVGRKESRAPGGVLLPSLFGSCKVGESLLIERLQEEAVTSSAYIYVDPEGTAVGVENVFTKLEAARKHYETAGLGADYIERFIR
jgi:hypothetical protein